MTALDAVVQRVHTHDNVHHLHPPEPVPTRPPRLNLAGYCAMCLAHGCTSERCDALYEASVWEICRRCDGSGYNANTAQFCDCESGLVDLTYSAWPNRPVPRPPRLNFAGWCLWCPDRWCDNPTCIDRHPRSIWAVCDRCDGRGHDEYTADRCGCSYGLIETQLTR